MRWGMQVKGFFFFFKYVRYNEYINTHGNIPVENKSDYVGDKEDNCIR